VDSPRRIYFAGRSHVENHQHRCHLAPPTTLWLHLTFTNKPVALDRPFCVKRLHSTTGNYHYPRRSRLVAFQYVSLIPKIFTVTLATECGHH